MPTLSHLDHLGDASFQQDWTRLLADDPDATTFQSPRFLRVWAAVLGTDLDVSTTAAHDGDQLVAVVPQAVGEEPDGVTWRFAGGTEVTDYTGPVAPRDVRAAFAKTWVPTVLAASGKQAPSKASTTGEGAQRVSGAGRVVFGGLATDTSWPDEITAAAADAGTSLQQSALDVCPVVDISDGHDAWMDGLPGKMRQELRRKTRKLVRDIGSVSIDQVDPADLEAGLETFLAMQADAAGPKASFFQRPVMRDFFVALADEFAADDVFRLHVLSIGDRPAAATVSLVADGWWGLYNSAFDPALAAMAPGMVLVTELIREAADDGCATFDLLRGDEAYKYRFGAVDRDLVALSS